MAGNLGGERIGASGGEGGAELTERTTGEGLDGGLLGVGLEVAF
jgi:hypothetical protein